MRKMQEQQAVELIKLLEQVHNELKKTIEYNDFKTAQSLLADCQNGAIELGTLIEKTEGENFKTIPIIEDYCEQAYQLYEKLDQADDINPNKAYKTLRQQLIKIENSVKNDIPIKKEVVFIPYKASMWDSLESVWKAANEDELCDAYVIPIPYYDKAPNGDFRQMHYEGDQYPKYVPITKYEDYDFEQRRPDMIFIHNPYDEYNLVTSVPPFFFSKNLKQFTDKLIYIPYFILDEISPDNEEAIKGMSHFCTVPGVVNANIVIVQSEKMKQIYVNVLSDMYGEESQKVWKEKILGLGSPKFDRVLNTQKENLEIPEEWLKIIDKPDGSRKKIILYNTGIAALLKNNEKMLEKIKDVFEVFKENKDKIVLLWRPHPLIKATVSSMRPKLWDEYKKIVEHYKSENWGIYDDTADIERAIALSDAYYGDVSSVMQMCQKAGIPIMIQNPNILTGVNCGK